MTQKKKLIEVALPLEAINTAGRDLRALVELGLLIAQGKGRGVRYTPSLAPESTGNRPAR